MLSDASSRWSTITPEDDEHQGRKMFDLVCDFFGNYLRISALLTHESDYNVGVSRFAALHGEENYSGQGCKETYEKAGGEEGAGEEDHCQEGAVEEEAGCP
jgi:hypothetical protein